MSKDNGGPAFPAPEASTARFGIGNEDAFMGMTLRDYFAAKALAGTLANIDLLRATVPESHNQEQADKAIARHCYSVADAMISERAR